MRAPVDRMATWQRALLAVLLLTWPLLPVTWPLLLLCRPDPPGRENGG